ncbi:MAG: OmpA family protein [Muribaculaceae bacterium]|nr:OmpA family protein [Muribaculaceae bacterium]
MRRLFCYIIAASLIAGISCHAQKKNSDFDPFTATIEENLSTPAVQSKHSETVSTAMGLLLRTLRKAGYNVTGVRSGEVVMVTIPCSDLFGANSTKLKPDAGKILSPLRPYMTRTDNYKVMIAVHTDNTGDAIYADQISSERANAIDEFYFHASGDNETGFIPYGLGADEPVASNAGIASRAKNRRVEIYFVPTTQFIEKARKNKAI